VPAKGSSESAVTELVVHAPVWQQLHHTSHLTVDREVALVGLDAPAWDGHGGPSRTSQPLNDLQPRGFAESHVLFLPFAALGTGSGSTLPPFLVCSSSPLYE
jgi:hypothetical protein